MRLIRMGPLHWIKTVGYLISSLSVALLGAVAWKGAKDDSLLLAFLIAGMATSVLGMALRWLSYQLDRTSK